MNTLLNRRHPLPPRPVTRPVPPEPEVEVFGMRRVRRGSVGLRAGEAWDEAERSSGLVGHPA